MTTENPTSDHENNNDGTNENVTESTGRHFWSEELLTFCNEASIVGLNGVARESTSPVRRICWILLLICGASFTVYQFQNRISYYFTYPTNVDVSVEYVNEMRFPTVMICSENRVGRSIARVYGVEDICLALFPPFPMPSFEPDWFTYEILTQRIKVDWLQVYYNTGMSPEHSIYACSYNSKECYHDDFIRIGTDYGTCLVFNSGNSNYTTKGTGVENGLRLMLYVYQDDYMYTNSYSSGFRVLLHEPNETPLMRQLAFRVSPGVTTQVVVDTEVHIELPPPYGTCDNTFNYTQSFCLVQCQRDYVVSRCGCKDGAQPGDFDTCSPKSYYECWFPSMTKFVSDNVAATCGCRRQCQKTTYNYVVTQSEFSEHYVSHAMRNWNLSISREDMRRNYAALEIYFAELKHTYIISSVAYSGLTLLCDVGGALGLILGSTLLTVCEFFDLLVTLIVEYLRQSLCKPSNKVEQSATMPKEGSIPELQDVES